MMTIVNDETRGDDPSVVISIVVKWNQFIH